MNSEQITKNISSLLSRIYLEIELLNHSGLHDKNIFAENLMLQLFNAMYGNHFINANVKSRKSNYTVGGAFRRLANRRAFWPSG